MTLSRCFELYDADVFTFKFMEQNCRDFPQADAARVLGKCRAAVGTAEVRGGGVRGGVIEREWGWLRG